MAGSVPPPPAGDSPDLLGALQESLIRARHEHRGDHCHQCSKELCEVVPWPCPTIAALEGDVMTADNQAAPTVDAVELFAAFTPTATALARTFYGIAHQLAPRDVEWTDEGLLEIARMCDDLVRDVLRPAVAVPAETRDAPHDPAHLMYDADTGVCLDCDRIVDPIAAPVAAAFPAAMRAYQDAAEFTEAEDAERVVTAILRAAFRTALKGTS